MPKSAFDLINANRQPAPEVPEAKSAFNLLRSTKEEEEPSSLLDKVFKVVGRPGAATAGAVAGALNYNPELPMGQRILENLRGDRTDTFDKVLEEQGFEDTRTRNIAGFAGDLILDPLNLIPASAIAKGAKAVGKVTGLAKAGKALAAKPAVAELGEKFIPGYGLKEFTQRAPEAGKPALSYWDTARLHKSELNDAQERAYATALRVRKGLSPEDARELSFALDEGRVFDQGHKLEPLRAEVENLLKTQFGREVEAGVMKPQQEIKNYITYLLNQPGLENTAVRALSGKTRFAKPRNLKSLKQAVAAGADPDIGRIVGARLAGGEKALLNTQFFTETAKQFGQKVGRKHPTPAGWRVVNFPVEEPSKQMLKGIAFPENIAKDLERLVELPKEWGAWRTAFHGMTALWKGYATRLNPAFHFRNFTSNIANSWLGGIKAQDIVPRHAAALQWHVTGKAPAAGKFTADEVADAAHRYGVVGGHFTSFNELDDLVTRDLENLTGSGRSRLFNSQWSPLAPNNRALRAGAELGNLVENASRRAVFLDQLHKGKSLEEAALHVRKYLFDYSELTDTEKKIRDFGIPFYTWIRKNLPLQLESAFLQPRKFAAMAKMENALENASESEGIRVPKDKRPEWMNELGSVQLPTITDKGAKMFWNPALPAQDINALPTPSAEGMKNFLQKDVLARLNPALKVPIEVAMGREAFSGRDLYNQSPDELRPANALATALSQGAGAVGIPELTEALGIHSTRKGVEMPAMLDYAMRQLPMTQTFGRVLAEPTAAKDPGHLSEAFLGASPGQLNAMGITNKALTPRELREVAKRRNRERKANTTRERREKARLSKTHLDSLYERYLNE